MAFKFWKVAHVAGSPANKKNSNPLEPYNDLTAAIAKKVAEHDIKKENKENKTKKK